MWNEQRGIELMDEFSVIPVMDLKGGAVVHARGGKRSEYRPFARPLGAADDPLAIARSLMAATLSPILYIADIDAIEGTGNNFDICRDLAEVLPNAELWIDAGFTDVTDCAFWLPLGATLVVGTEKLPTTENWRELKEAFGAGLVLSLDFGGEGALGPRDLHEAASLWPNRVIVIDMPRVGSGEGPDLERLRSIRDRSNACSIFAGGGVRHVADMEALAEIGAAGALVATALHNQAIAQNEIAAFLQRRRSV